MRYRFFYGLRTRARASVFHYDISMHPRIAATWPFVTTVASSPSLMHSRPQIIFLLPPPSITRRRLCRNFGTAMPLTGSVSLNAQSNSSRVLRFWGSRSSLTDAGFGCRKAPPTLFKQKHDAIDSSTMLMVTMTEISFNPQNFNYLL